MNYYVVEVISSIVQRVQLFTHIRDAESYAKLLCKENGIYYQGKISVDGDVENYSVQIVDMD